MPQHPLAKYPIIHVGSTKNLRLVKKITAKAPGVFRFEFTDDYSVFDYGKMPDRIPNKGASAAMMSAFLFEEISKPSTWKAFAAQGGLDAVKNKKLRAELAGSPVLKKLMKSGFPTHYKGIVNEKGEAVPLAKLKGVSNILEVAAVRIIRPNVVVVGGKRLYNYSDTTAGLTNHLVPLECVFRFGMPKGSSLVSRLQNLPGYAEELGLAKAKEGGRLPRPVVELFSKLEPADRFLNFETAMNFAGLTGDEFITLLHATLLVALWLKVRFAAIGIELHDGKFEFLRLAGSLALGDAVTPDELRLTYKNLQISKEPLRQFHHKNQSDFVEAMKEAKKIAQGVDKELSEIVAELGHPPRPLPEEMIGAISDMYAGITEKMLGRDIFGGRATLADVTKKLKKLGVA